MSEEGDVLVTEGLRKEFGGLKLDQAKRLKELERRNAKLNRHQK